MTTLPNPSVPHYPTNEQVNYFVRLMQGQARQVFFNMRESILTHIGTPQATQDWSRPDEWIGTILSGDELMLANRIWQDSRTKVNPRHVTGVWLLCSQYDLLAHDERDILYGTEAGFDFISNPDGKSVQQIDYGEGLLNLLLIISEQGRGKRSDYLPSFTDFLQEFSRYRSQAAIKSAWYGRIGNLVARGYVARSGVTYEITQDGLTYLERVGTLLQYSGRDPVTEPQTAIRQYIKVQHQDVRNRMRETLANLDPYHVEFVVKRLLEAMDYQNVEVTSKGGDGGVDVVADIEVGITPVREVVQVKRRKHNIQRRTLDELRGSLHRFDATRGTIITTGGFSSGAKEAAFERGAAPITLIDGERLIDLLIENEIGVRKRTLQVVEFEPVDFSSLEVEE